MRHAKHLEKYTDGERKLIIERLWTRPDNYAGDDFFGTIGVVGQSRDSRVLERCNFAVALEMLGGRETKDVFITRAGHWAVGWVESLRVNIRNVRRTRQALEIIKTLAGYGVLDDFELSHMEMEEANETFDFCRDDFVGELEKYLGRSVARLPKSDVKKFLFEVFHEDGGYRGYEDAWVNAESIRRYIGAPYSTFSRLVDSKNRVALALNRLAVSA